MKLRIIFQGGGARVATLLAAADALKRVAALEGYVIEEAAGVSAGSIAAAALAGDCPIDDVRQRLLDNSAHLRSRAAFILAASRMENGKKHNTIRNLRDFIILRWIWSPLLRVAKIFWYGGKVAFGFAIINPKKLQNLLVSVFSTQNAPIKMKDVPRLTVFSSKLQSGKSKIYSHSHPKNDAVESVEYVQCSEMHVGEIIARSSRMPIVFGGYWSSREEVDGGVNGNLPSPYFYGNSVKGYPTILFAFPHEEREVKGITSFLLALLGSAMDSNVRNARAQAARHGGVVCELQNHVGTFDPIGLERELDRQQFVTRSREIERDVRQSLRELMGFEGHEVIRSNDYAQSSVAQAMDALYRKFPVNRKCSIKISVDGRVRRDEGRKDERCYVDVFSPENGRIEVCQVGLPTKLVDATDLVIRVLDNAQREIANKHFKTYVEFGTIGGFNRNRIIIHFLDQLAVLSSPITVVVRLQGPIFDDYWSRGWDFASTNISVSNEVSDHIWVAVQRKENAVPSLQDICDQPPDQLAELEREVPLLALRLKNWTRGEALEEAEANEILNRYYREDFRVGHAKVAFGWRARDLHKGQSAGYCFRRPS